MLSYENNLSDPLKSIGKSTVQNNSSSSRDENITGDNNSLPETEHQLISSSVVEVPNFSIRDFVFSARNKDIGTNWPFPEKHLKLCLKHGVRDLLPPFESRTSKKKLSSTICLENRSLVDDAIIARIQDEESSERVGSLTVPSSGDVGLTQKITASHHLDVLCDKPVKDGDFLSSDTSNSQAYPSKGRGTFKHHRIPKISAKTSSSKCKLVVKFGSPSVHSSNEEIMPHKTNLSDAPASKVCPVCKTFTSSSNTTLNAHIDQCLSMETASEGLTDSRTTAKCKVKARKMRSMVDIYTTALVCTIEDLDRRNGTSWATPATGLSVPACHTGVSSAKGKEKQTTSPSEPDNEDNADGGVYIDANGRKIRILSKMDSFSSVVTTKEDNGSRKLQISKTLSPSMKKHHGTKHHKFLKRAVSNGKLLDPNASSSKVLRSHKSLDDSLLLRASRDTVEADTYRGKGAHQHPRHNIHAAHHPTAKFQKSRMGGVGGESSSKDFDRDSSSLNESHERNNSLDDIHISARHCLGVKRTRSSISKDNKYYKMKTNVHNRLKKSTIKPLNLLNRGAKGINENRGSNTKHVHHFLQKTAKLHRDYISSSNERLVHDPKIWKGTLCSTNEEDRMQIEVEDDGVAGSDEIVAALRSESHVMHDTEPECNQNQLLTVERRINQLEKEKRGVNPISQDGALNVNICNESVDNLSVPLSRSKGVEHGSSETPTEPRNKFTAERIMRTFIRSMNPVDQERADSYEYQSSPQASNDSSTGPNCSSSPPDQVLDEGICSFNMESDSKAITQGNICSDIDPIPIPGPPGAFLPSPGNAETEDYQGNSSLTSNLSPHYEQDDGNTPKYPTTSASNLAAEITSKLSEKFTSPKNHVIPDSLVLGFPIPSSKASAIEAYVFPRSMISGSARSEYGDQKTYMKVQDENEPCCCSRKERVNRGSSAVDYQESQLMRRRSVSVTMLPTKENTSCSLNTAPSYSSAGADIYSLSSSSFRAVDTPVLKAPTDFASPKYSETMNASKFHTNGGSESASPSAVLRLMGKNLLVTKNDEGVSGPSRGDAIPSNTNTQMTSEKAVSPCKHPSLRSYCSPFQSAVRQDPGRNSPSNDSNMRHTYEFRTYDGGPWGEINSQRPRITNLQAELFDRQWPVQHNVPYNGYAMMADHMHKHQSLPIDFRKAGSEVDACRNSITVSNSLNYTGASTSMAAAEHDQSRLICPVYSPAPFSSTPMYVQQLPGNTCFPVPFSSGHLASPYYPQNGSYVQHGGGLFMASSLSRSTQPRPGLFYSHKLP